MESLSKTALFRKYGGPECLEIELTAIPRPGPGEVRLKVDAFALNRADLLMLNNQHYTIPVFPSRIASEAAGVVDELGEGVTDLRPGDRVSTIPFHSEDSSRHGVAGEYAIVPAQFCAPWPSGFSSTEACSIWMQYLTAYFPLHEICPIKRGDSVLVAAASSSAGQAAVQIAKSLDAFVIATTRSEEKTEALLKAGADEVIVIAGVDDLAERVLLSTNGVGVKLAYDPVGGSFLDSYVEAMAIGGVIILYGLLSGEATTLPIVAMVRRASVMHPYSMFNHVSDASQLARGVNTVLEGLEAGTLRPLVDRVFQLSEIVEAYKYMESNQQCGKIVVDVTERG